MKTTHFLMAGLVAATLLAACSAPSGEGTAPDPSARATATTQAPEPGNAAAEHGSTTGIITAIDPAAKAITIDHGPVPALDWPAMTMSFHAPGIDLSGFEPGDRVSFEFSASGMTATITALEHQ